MDSPREPNDPQREADLAKCPEWVVARLRQLEEVNHRQAREIENLKEKVVFLMIGGSGETEFTRLMQESKANDLKKGSVPEFSKSSSSGKGSSPSITSLLSPRGGSAAREKAAKKERRKDSSGSLVTQSLSKEAGSLPSPSSRGDPSTNDRNSADSPTPNRRKKTLTGTDDLKSTLESRADRAHPVLRSEIKTIQDLPRSSQQAIEHAGLSEDLMNQHLDMILNILSFQKYIVFKNENDEEKIEKLRYYAPFTPQLEASLTEHCANPKSLFKILEKVGSGGFGVVYRGKDKTGKLIAIKKSVYETEKQKRLNLHEISFLKKMHHPNIVQVHSAYLIDGTNEIWISMEFLEGGTLTEAVRKQEFKGEHIAFVAYKLLEALKYLHENKVAHRDLKSANIMLSVTADVKIVDFGLCCFMSEPRTEVVGSPFWMPPEMIMRQKHSFPVDIWSLGISLLELANGEPPNRENAIKALATVGLSGVPQPFPNPAKAPKYMADFVSLTLKMNPDERPSAEELIKHPFVATKSKPMEMKSLLLRIFSSNAIESFM